MSVMSLCISINIIIKEHAVPVSSIRSRQMQHTASRLETREYIAMSEEKKINFPEVEKFFIYYFRVKFAT